MIDIHAWGTSNSLRATLALAESGLPHRLVPVDVGRKEQKSPAYLALNPAGQLPTIVDHDAPGGPLVLTQSGAIVLYVCRKAGRHVPVDPAAHAMAMQWFMQAASDIAGMSAGLNQVARTFGDTAPDVVASFEQRLLGYFALADQHLDGRDFLAGDYSVADIMLYPNYAMRRALLDRHPVLPHLRAWGERVAQRPATAAGMQLLQTRKA